MSASPQIATLAALSGAALLRAPDGSTRELQPGSVLPEGGILVTAPDASVELQFDDGSRLVIGAGRSITLSAELADADAPDAGEAALGGDSLARLFAALGDGTGNTGPVVGSSDFVHLLRQAESGSLSAAGDDGDPDILPWTLSEADAPDTDLSVVPPADGDALDMLDLLPPASTDNLASYLQIEANGSGGTLVHISSTGGFTGDPRHDAGVAHRTVELQHLDPIGLGGDHQQIIDNLVSNGKLIVE